MKNHPKARILVVDDDLFILALHCRMLQWLGYETMSAGDGIEALEKLRRSDSFDLVLTDINLPFLNGWELAKRVRKLDRKIPIVAITGNCPEVVLAQVRGSGIVHVLFKPLQINLLRDALWSVLDAENDASLFSSEIK